MHLRLPPTPFNGKSCRPETGQVNKQCRNFKRVIILFYRLSKRGLMAAELERRAEQDVEERLALEQ